MRAPQRADAGPAADARRGPGRLARAIAIAILLAYPALAGGLLLTRNGWAVNRANVAAWYTTLGPGGLNTGISPERFSDLANVVLFIPPLAALALLVPTWWWVLLGLAASSGIETAQLLRGGRDATMVDVLTNTLGAALGVLLGRWLRRRLSGAAGGPAGVGPRAAGARTTPAADPSATAPDPGAAPDDRD